VTTGRTEIEIETPAGLLAKHITGVVLVETREATTGECTTYLFLDASLSAAPPSRWIRHKGYPSRDSARPIRGAFRVVLASCSSGPAAFQRCLGFLSPGS
jgi:hypothetical protein